MILRRPIRILVASEETAWIELGFPNCPLTPMSTPGSEKREAELATVRHRAGSQRDLVCKSLDLGEAWPFHGRANRSV